MKNEDKKKQKESWPKYLLKELADPWLFRSEPQLLKYPLILASGPILAQKAFQKKSQKGKWFSGLFQGAPLQFLRISAGTSELELAIPLFKEKGVQGLLFLSICGGLIEDYPLGSIVQVDCAEVGEGMSPYYGFPSGSVVEAFQTISSPYPKVRSFTTQSLLKETPEHLEGWKQENQIIECEFSALFTLCQVFELPVLALSVISDQPFKGVSGIQTPVFRHNAESALQYLQKLQGEEEQTFFSKSRA
jgi:nucleoside phosphorylase